MKERKLGDKIRLQHILDAIENIEKCKQEVKTYEDHKNNIIISSSISYSLCIVGESSNHLSDELQSQYSNINWRSIIDLSNIVIP